MYIYVLLPALGGAEERYPTEYLLDLGCERGSLGGSQRIKAITQQVVLVAIAVHGLGRNCPVGSATFIQPLKGLGKLVDQEPNLHLGE